MRFIGGRPSSAHALLPDVLAPTYNGETSIEMSRKWVVAQMGCRADGMSRNWKVAQIAFPPFQIAGDRDFFPFTRQAVSTLLCITSKKNLLHVIFFKWHVILLSFLNDS